MELEGVKLEEQSRNATDTARQSGEEKKQIVPPDLLEEVFELNMQLEEARMNKKLGEDDPALRKDLALQKATFEKKYETLAQELEGRWNEWDQAIEDKNEEARKRALGGLV